MRLYFAGPLFSDAERAFNADLAAAIERVGIEVFLPQRDGVEREVPPYDQLPADERRTRMFATDRDEVLGCDVFLLVTDGRVPDEGAAVELGIAYAHRHLTGRERLIVGLRTDTRTAFACAGLNPMISEALDTLCRSTAELLTLLQPLAHGAERQSRSEVEEAASDRLPTGPNGPPEPRPRAGT